MQCIICRGDGCAACDDYGRIKITGCPRALVTDDVWQAFQAAALARKGSWPNAGGWLDQPRTLVDGVQMIWSDETFWKTRRGMPLEED